MTLILNNKSNRRAGVLFGTVFLLLTTTVTTFAQVETSQTLSVSPTLFQMTANPDQSWQSEIRIINVNDYDLTVYPQVVNFAPTGESGLGDFVPVFSAETNGQTLAEWIKIVTEGIVIPRQQTVTLPFTVSVPNGAAPGGHYAAILIGTKPAANKNSESLVQTAQFVSSLFFVRISGDVNESGAVREFRTSKLLYQIPEVSFEVRFENTGNVHLQPQGDITITNMWGEERGAIPINQQTHFGNVLPDSIRKFEFSWKGAESALDIGRYKAVVTLGYGDEAKNFTTSTTYFWIVPYKQIGIILSVLIALIWFFTFAVKLYIKRMLLLSGFVPPSDRLRTTNDKDRRSTTDTVQITRYQTVLAPVRTGLGDLWSRLRTRASFVAQVRAVVDFIGVYKIFFITCVVVVSIVVFIFVLLSRVNAPSRQYEVTINNPDAQLTISSERIYYDNLKAQGTPVPATITPEYAQYNLDVVNVSGEIGVAAKLRLLLEAKGYVVTSLSGDLKRADERTVILYNPTDQEAALTLSKQLKGALLSADPSVTQSHFTINVGADQGQ